MARSRIKVVDGLLFSGAAESPAERAEGKRQLRKGQILSLLRTKGPLARIEIARTLGFNHRSVSLLVDKLLADGLVLEQEERRTGGGRRPVPIALNPAAACVLGIDIGRTRTAMAFMDLEGALLAREQRPSEFTAEPAEQVQWIISFVREFLSASKAKLPPLAGVAFAPEGLLHRQVLPESSEAVAAPLQKQLASMLRVPVFSDDDSRLLALGEQWFGEARSMTAPAIFNLTDGLGLTCLQDGRMITGSRGWAGQVGHLPLGEPDIPCFCGSAGCLENTASGTGLLRMAKAAGIPPRMRADVDALARAARSGHGEARALFSKFGEALGLGVAMTMNLFNPDGAVLGGRLAQYADLYLSALQAELAHRTIPYIREAAPVVVSELSDTAVLLGACALVLSHIYDPAHATLEDLL